MKDLRWANALGKIVVTNSLAKDIYKKEYGDCALHIANDPNELYAELSKILRMSNLVEQADAIISKETKDKAVQIIKNKIERLKELRQERENIEKQINHIERVLEEWSDVSAEAIVKYNTL
jgi:hypothetical protein